jgi:hypothetical protein
MPLPISVSPPTVLYQRDVIWPDWTVRLAETGAFSQTASLSSGQGGIGCWGAAAGGGGNLMALINANEWVGYFQSGGAAAVLRTAQYKAYMPLLRLTYLPTYAQPIAQRLYRVQVVMREGLGGNFTMSGFVFCPEIGTEAGNPAAAGNRFFGVVGNGDGTWAFRCRKGGGAGFDEVVPLGINAAQFHVFDLVIRGATGSADASFSIFVDGIQLLTRSWTVATTLLPNYSSPVNASHFTPMMGAYDAAFNSRLDVAFVRFMMGNFMPDGSAI